MASLVNKPLTSLCTANRSDIRSPEFFVGKFCRIGARKSGNSVRIASSGVVSRKISDNANEMVCKAVSVEPHTEIEGLNIAEDVTQV